MKSEKYRNRLDSLFKYVKRDSKKIISLAVILLFFIIDIKAIGFAPIRNFSRQTYNAGSQNWAFAQDNYGRVYFANRDGLLKYDGIRWSLHYLPNYTTVRSLFADNDSGKIYVGGSGEFGYFLNDSTTHKLQYFSLSSYLPEEERNFTEIWNIHKIENGKIVFQGDFKIFIFGENSISALSSKDKITTSGYIGGHIYAGTQTGELLIKRNSSLQSVLKLKDSNRIVALLPYERDKLLIVTANGGLYFYGSGEIIEANWDISSYLKENQTFNATFSSNIYAFGTVNGGCVVKNIDTNEVSYINKQTGLMNNTVLGLGFDYSDNLWLCLDNGLGYAMVDSPIFNLLGDESESGAGYASMLYGNNLLLGTNRGLFSTFYPLKERVNPPELQRLHSGQVWSIDSIGSDIFISADDGLFILPLDNSILYKIPGIETGNWSVSALNSKPGKAIASTYSGFYILSKDNNGWRAQNRIEGYEDAGGKFVEDKDGNLWFAHWIKGIYKFVLSPDLKSFKEIKLYTSADGLPSERENTVTLYKGEIRVITASGDFYLQDPRGLLVKDNILSGNIPLNNSVHYFTLPNGVSFALSPTTVWKIKEDKNGKMEIDSLTLRLAANSLIPGFEHIGMIDDNNILISHQEGFYNVTLGNGTKSGWKNKVFIETLAAGDTILFSGITDGNIPELKIPYTQNSLTFSFAAPEYRHENAILFSCRLDNYDKEWSTPSETSSKEYTQLGEGDYTLHVRAINTITGETSETSFAFTILPPWYRSVLAKLVYTVFLLILIFYGYKFFRYLSQRNARKMKEQKEAEMESLRKEAEKEAIRKDFEIASLKSEQLEQDIKHKSSELSNTTMNVIRKNEILLDISSRLRKIQEKAATGEKADSKLNGEIDTIQTLIHDNISHDDDWKKFHQNFDIVYSDFTRHLAERHPNLTVSEKRLCCYLKMGLSSKDIAPIFSISPKSVEMNRYRLRSKLGLKRENNLIEYLQGI